MYKPSQISSALAFTGGRLLILSSERSWKSLIASEISRMIDNCHQYLTLKFKAIFCISWAVLYATCSVLVICTSSMVVQNYCARARHSNVTRPTHHSNMEVNHSKTGALPWKFAGAGTLWDCHDCCDYCTVIPDSGDTTSELTSQMMHVQLSCVTFQDTYGIFAIIMQQGGPFYYDINTMYHCSHR